MGTAAQTDSGKPGAAGAAAHHVTHHYGTVMNELTHWDGLFLVFYVTV